MNSSARFFLRALVVALASFAIAGVAGFAQPWLSADHAPGRLAAIAAVLTIAITGAAVLCATGNALRLLNGGSLPPAGNGAAATDPALLCRIGQQVAQWLSQIDGTVAAHQAGEPPPPPYAEQTAREQLDGTVAALRQLIARLESLDLRWLASRQANPADAGQSSAGGGTTGKRLPGCLHNDYF